MAKRNTTLGVLVFYAVTLTVSLLILLSVPRPGAQLTAAEVQRNAKQLAALLERTRLDTSHRSGLRQMTYTFADACGSFLGLAIISQTGSRPETELAVRLQAERWSLLRSPERAPLPLLRVIRDDAGSDLVARRDPGRIAVLIETSRRPADHGEAPSPLRVNNLRGRAGWRGEMRVGREFAPFTSAHCKFQSDDLRVFAILSRILRARICDDLDVEGSVCYDTALAIYRDRKTDRYRIDLRSLAPIQGRLSFVLEISRSTDGLITDGILTLDSRSNLAKAANLFVTRPRRSGELLSPQDEGFEALRFSPQTSESARRSARIDFSLLLGDTTWLQE